MKNNSIIHCIAEAHVMLASKGASRIYYRDSIAKLPATTDRSRIYSRSQARQIFALSPHVMCVEYVTGGCKMESQLVGVRGMKRAPKGTHVIISSTGGRWGKSRRDYVAA